MSGPSPKQNDCRQTEAHRHAVDENHNDAKFVFAGIERCPAAKSIEKSTAEAQKLQIVLHSLVQITSEDPASTQFGGKVMDSRTPQLK